MKIKGLIFWLLSMLLAAALLVATAPVAKAQGATCTVVFQPSPPPGQFVQVCSGGGGGGGEEPPAPGSCVPDTPLVLVTYVPVWSGLCQINLLLADPCTGEILNSWQAGIVPCPEAPPATGVNPCVEFTITPGGIGCRTSWGLAWQLEASVGFPETFLDLRPYPATLVRWPTAARNGGQPVATGTGSRTYIAYGGGSPGAPEVGDWRDVVLTLQLAPAGPLFFSMPNIGTLALPEVGPTGQPAFFQWEVPSHPVAGGSLLAGSVAGLGSLPPDLPLFVGSAQSSYRLFWNLSFERYLRECEAGADPPTGAFNCETGADLGYDDGHWAYRWDPRSRGGEITPQTVVGLPPELAADVNGDGVPDAYWNRAVTVRRMDEADRVDNPQWAASWNWGGAVYWAVREGQGQIGWPGGP